MTTLELYTSEFKIAWAIARYHGTVARLVSVEKSHFDQAAGQVHALGKIYRSRKLKDAGKTPMLEAWFKLARRGKGDSLEVVEVRNV
ncbi:MAG: hypothetical protein LBD02_10650 [Christensenellaceae bacterium]|jgi:hypothetical protein|nr:hypothetical protein [Christensenellaceae bacterium]